MRDEIRSRKIEERIEIMVNYVEGVLRNVIKELDVGVLLAGEASAAGRIWRELRKR